MWTSNGPIYIVDRVLFPDIPDTSEPQKDDEAEIVPAPEVAAESNEVVSDVASTGSTASEDAGMPSQNERLTGLWDDLLQWSNSFRPSNLFGRFFFLQI